MKFNLYSIPVIFNDEFQIYNSCRSTFLNTIEDLMENFHSVYYQNVNSVNNVIDAVANYYSKVSNSLTTIAVQLLVHYDILNCNEEIFQEKYFNIFSNTTTMNALMKKVDDIEGAYSQRQQEKAIERASRSQWVGGGYGIGGAIKAEAMNMVTDGFRSIGDSYSDNKDKQRVLDTLSSLIKDNSVYQGIYSDIKTTGINIFKCFLNELYENGIISFVSFDEKKSNAKFENVIRFKTNPNEILHSVVECIQDNPYEIKYYEYLIHNFGDSDKEIEKISEYLDFEEDIQKCKNEIMQDILDMKETNCAEIYKKIKKIQKSSTKLGRNFDTEISRLNQLDIQYRTVDSILFKTEQEANILKKCLNMTEDSYDKVCEKIKTTKETEKRLSINLKKHIDKLETKEKNLRNIKGIQCETYKDAQQLQICFDMEEQDYNEVIKKLGKFAELQKKIKNLSETEQVKSCISQLEKKEIVFRTVENIEYKTIEEADNVRKILSELDKAAEENFETWTIEELLAEKEKAQKYNYQSYVKKIENRIALLKERFSESEEYYEKLLSINLFSKEVITSFEGILNNIKHKEVKNDVENVLSIFKSLINFRENVNSFKIPYEVNKILSDIKTAHSAIKMEKYKNIFQPEMLEEINQKLNYLQSDDYKQEYEKAYKYQSSINDISSGDMPFYIIWIVVVWLVKGFLYRWFFQGGWITKGIIIIFVILPTFSFVIMAMTDIGQYLKRFLAKVYVLQHPECEDIWKKLTDNGTITYLDYYH